MNIAILQTKLPEFIKKKLTPVSYTQKAIVVNSEDDLKKGKEIVKEISGLSKSFKEYIAPIKKMFDEAHAVVTTFEKENLANGKKISDEQEKENSDWNRRVFECQQAKENYLRDFAGGIQTMTRNFEQGKADFEARCNQILAEIELERIKSLPVPIAEKIDAIEEARKEVEKPVENVIIPQVEIPIEKIALKKDTKKEVKTFYVKDELAAIEWCIKNNRRDLLTITLSKKAINEALKDEDFQTLNFVSFTSEYK